MKKINHIAILLDRSASMRGLAPGVIKQYNAQTQRIAQNAASSNQETRLSLYTFGDVADRPLLFEVPLSLVQLKPLDTNTYVPEGWTAMLDSIGMAIEDLSFLNRGSTEDDSYLVICITDGEENRSVKFKKLAAQMMLEKMRTDAWTFVFLVPKPQGGQNYKRMLIENFGIAEGNVQEWDQTAKGVEEYSRATMAGLDSYFQARSQGKRSVRSFFATDLSGVSTAQVASHLQDLTGKFKKSIVSAQDITCTDQHGNKCAVIEPFCQKKFGQYVVRNGYYQLMKVEKVQDHKQIIVEDKSTGRLYGGPEGRNLLGLPGLGEVRVHPGDHGKFNIYVQSTSVNRKLPLGTAVLYLPQ